MREKEGRREIRRGRNKERGDEEEGEGMRKGR